MKILFDHGTPAPLHHQLAGHEISTAYETGWAKLSNGDLLAAAEKSFDAFITTTKPFATSKISPADGWRFWFCPRQAGRKFKSTRARFLMLSTRSSRETLSH